MIEIKDYIPYRVVGYDATYLYAIKTGASGLCELYRLTSSIDAPATPIKVWPTGTTVRTIWSTPDYPGVLLAQVNGDIYKSIDFGSNWGNNTPSHNNMAYCMRIGQVGSPKFSSSMLAKGLVFNGQDVYLAEYNVSPGRVPGGTNDAVKILKSADLGTTWAMHVAWNTDGNHYIRHMHGICVDNGYFYILCGDTDSESGILRWNPTQPITGNQPLSAYAECFYGAQRYRTGDILSPPGQYMYWYSDTTVGDGERGIWRANKDMTGTPQRVDSQIVGRMGMSGWYGTITPAGDMVMTEFIEAGADGTAIAFYGSEDGGTTWKICGKFGVVLGKGGCDSFFTWGSEMFFVKTGHSGKAPETCTLVLQAKVYSDSDGARILNPVYWVSTAGSDTDAAEQGCRPSKPWRSLGHALKNSRITHGSRVIVSQGVFDAPVQIDWLNNAYPAVSYEPVLIEGATQGAGTVLSGSIDTLISRPRDMPVRIKDINQPRNAWSDSTANAVVI